MLSEILVVKDVRKSVQFSPLSWLNKVVQELGGQYYFVDGEEITEAEYENRRTTDKVWTYFEHEWPADEEGNKHKSYHRYLIWELPLKIAYFLIETARISKELQVIDFPPNEQLEHGPVQAYFLPGTEVFGKKIEKLTPVPVELRPVIVEKI